MECLSKLLQPLRLFNLVWKSLVSAIVWQYSKIKWWVDGAPCKLTTFNGYFEYFEYFSWNIESNDICLTVVR